LLAGGYLLEATEGSDVINLLLLLPRLRHLHPINLILLRNLIHRLDHGLNPQRDLCIRLKPSVQIPHSLKPRDPPKLDEIVHDALIRKLEVVDHPKGLGGQRDGAGLTL
jgi:hypothetical protein